MASTMHRHLLRASVGLVALLLLAHPACSHGGQPATQGPDAGPDAGADAGPDAGPDAGSPDAGCTSDSACGASRWCERATGLCRDAKPCPQGQGNCDYQLDPSAPDYCGGKTCYCDPADNGCKPLHAACTACAKNAECGSDKLAYDYPADCVPPDAGFADAGACIPRRDGYFGCPHGYATPASGSYCIPGGGHCGGQGACTSDDQCDPHSATPLCNPQLGLCVAACTFDLKTGDSPLCPQGLVCHLTPALAKLLPQDANYGKGRCAPPCTAATACGAGLVCRSEGLDHPVQRCGLQPPQCLGDVECPDSPSTASWGYCDLAAHACQTGCRSNTDCHAGYLCSNQACVAETCLQAGGAARACDYGQFCCGEAEGPAPCPASVDAGACYDSPQPTWCASCTKDDECRTSAFPTRAGDPNLCVKLANNKQVCALGCQPGHLADCPRSWGCQQVLLGCNKTDDCGSQAGAHCDLPADGGQGTCTCTADGNCPTGETCTQQKCVITNVCKPACP